MNKPDEKKIEEVLAGVSTPEDAANVARWFATDEGAIYLSKRFDQEAESISQENAELFINHKIPTDKILSQINDQIRRYTIRRYLFRVAAVLLPLVILLGIYIQLNSRLDLFNTSPYEEVYVPKGERLQMMFQDGTKVFLNSDSYLRYPCKFGLKERKVELAGEAYFIVSKNRNRPFIVDLDGTSVEVLGTSFNICAYPENENVMVNLDEGRINMKLNSDKTIPILPGEMVTYNKRRRSYVIDMNENSEITSAWKQNIIAFKDEPLRSVVVKLSRWYDVEFIADENIAGPVLITLTSKNTVLTNILSELNKITRLTFIYDEAEKKVYIKNK